MIFCLLCIVKNEGSLTNSQFKYKKIIINLKVKTMYCIKILKIKSRIGKKKSKILFNLVKKGLSTLVNSEKNHFKVLISMCNCAGYFLLLNITTGR